MFFSFFSIIYKLILNFIFMNRDKYYAIIYSALVGDSLGAHYEFLTSSEATNLLNNNIRKYGGLCLLPGGPFNILSGQITDDGEMLLCLLFSLTIEKKYNQKHSATAYILWFSSSPIDYGKTINNALNTRKRSETYVDMLRNSENLNKSSLSNGALMRIAPLGLFGATISEHKLHHIIKKECALTHPNKLVIEICYLYCLLIKYLLFGKDPQNIITILLQEAKHARSKIFLRDAQSVPEPTFVITPEGTELYINTDDQRYQGYIGVAFQNAVFEILHTTSYEQALINIIKRGGDTDTNCCIAGALYGAYYGMSGIKKEWIDSITNLNYMRYNKYKIFNPKKVKSYINKLIL